MCPFNQKKPFLVPAIYIRVLEVTEFYREYERIGQGLVGDEPQAAFTCPPAVFDLVDFYEWLGW